MGVKGQAAVTDVPPQTEGKPRYGQDDSQILTSLLLVLDGPRAAGCSVVWKGDLLMLGQCL